MHDLRSMTLDDMERLFMDEYAEPRFRAGQTYEWINKKLAASFGEMTSLPAALRERLGRGCAVSLAQIKEKYVSNDGLTTKYLLELEKETIIECVAMKYSYGWSVCVSSQAGCRMGCAFCASAIGGLLRDLTAGEMCAQVYAVQKDLGERVSRAVVMGSGEPFDNYDSLVGFLKIITSKRGLCLGARHITVSTCGLAEKIAELSREGLQVNLAVSLHAPNDGLRRQLMPIARKYGIDGLLAACAEYSRETGRRVTYEYSLIGGVNDTQACAAELAARLAGTLSHVNLIPLNETPGGRYKRSGRKAVDAFARTLAGKGVETTVRRGLGGDINGACGQLRHEYISRIPKGSGSA